MSDEEGAQLVLDGFDVPLHGDALVRVSSFRTRTAEYLEGRNIIVVEAEIGETAMSRPNTPTPPTGSTVLLQIMTTESFTSVPVEDLLEEQRSFDDGDYEDAYAMIRPIHPGEKSLRDRAEWTLFSAFSADRAGNVHFLGSGYKTDAMVRAARRIVDPDGTRWTSELAFTLDLARENLELTEAIPMNSALNAARARSVTTIPGQFDVPGVAGEGEHLQVIAVVQSPSLADPNRSQMLMFYDDDGEIQSVGLQGGLPVGTYYAVKDGTTSLRVAMLRDDETFATGTIQLPADPNVALEVIVPTTWSKDGTFTTQEIPLSEAFDDRASTDVGP